MSEAPRNRSPEYIAFTDALPRKPGTCSVCQTDLVGFCAGDLDFAHGDVKVTAKAIRAWFRFGCPVHDVFAHQYVGENEALCIVRHPSDPAWDWAPPSWRPALVEAGWGLPKLVGPFPTLRFGEHEGRAWVTDSKSLLALPPDWALAAAEEGFGLKCSRGRMDTTQATREGYRLDVGPVLNAAPRVATPAVPVRDKRAPDELLTLGSARVPRSVIGLVEAVYPSVAWRAAGQRDPVVGFLPEGTVALVMPVVRTLSSPEKGLTTARLKSSNQS